MNPLDSGVALRILIIEDDARYAEQLLRAFRSNHRGLRFDVSLVTSASEAEPFILRDQIDIYVVDLELPEFKAAPSEKVGELLVKKIIQSTAGGVIVHTHVLRKDRDDFLWDGVEDYIMKGDSTSNVVARAFAVWRRVKNTRHSKTTTRKNERAFKLGKWRFEEGNRNLIDDDGETIRLSPTELAFVKYLCTVDREIDRREFNVAVLGRPAYEEDKRIDNLVYRLRDKLGDTFQLLSRHDSEGTYKLLSFEQLPSK
jgi:DNA-binding response OmpR family regulator